jgi:hypothetical protein
MIVVNPILRKIMRKWLERKKLQSENDIKEIVKLLPSTQLLVTESWKKSAEKKGIKRISLFFKIVIFNLLQDA